MKWSILAFLCFYSLLLPGQGSFVLKTNFLYHNVGKTGKLYLDRFKKSTFDLVPNKENFSKKRIIHFSNGHTFNFASGDQAPYFSTSAAYFGTKKISRREYTLLITRGSSYLAHNGNRFFWKSQSNTDYTDAVLLVKESPPAPKKNGNVTIAFNCSRCDCSQFGIELSHAKSGEKRDVRVGKNCQTEIKDIPTGYWKVKLFTIVRSEWSDQAESTRTYPKINRYGFSVSADKTERIDIREIR